MLTALSAACATLLLVDDRIEGPNLVPNASFERGDLDTPTGWHRNVWSGDATFVHERNVGRTGNACVTIRSETGADASWSCRVAVRAHSDYRLRLWVRTDQLDAATGFGAQANLHELQMTGKTRALAGTNEWTQLESTFSSGARQEVLLNLLFGGWGRSTGSASFDDVEVVELTDPPLTMEPAAAERFFEDEVHPILAEHCVECHGDDRPRGGLFLGGREGLVHGGESGPAFDNERPTRSLLLAAVRYETYEMPPGGKLAPDDIETLTTWLRLGAPWSPHLDQPRPATDHAGDARVVDDAARAHWSFQSPVRPALPEDASDPWVRTPLDAFVRRGQRLRGFEPAPPASPSSLVRRLSYDLTGLPPDLATVETFVADPSDDAYEALVDRYLASPHFGETWARHWLDLVRYAETNSFERDGAKPHVWRYRDWVIRSFNDDLPFDDFVISQLAGDERAEPSADDIIATGYYRLGLWDDEPADPQQALYDDLDDILKTTSHAFLGLTVDCARCHDHKIDPIPQRDYYRMLAFFRGVRRYGVRGHDTVKDASVRIIASDEERIAHADASAAHEAELAKVRAAMEALEARVISTFEPVEHEEFKHENRRVALIRKRAPAILSDAEVTEYEAWTATRDRLRATPPPGLDEALCVKEHGPHCPPTHLLVRGNPHVPGAEVQPGFPEVLGAAAPSIPVAPNGLSSGRRMALAQWITAPDNPLTARVFVNRVWQHLFGAGLVRTPSDYGTQGARPTHPDLLDWLACDFRDGWRVKALIRQLVLSNTYRMSSAMTAELAAADPTNEALTRASMRRLTAEEVRDSILAVSGSLTRTSYGPSVYPTMPEEVLAGQSRPGEGWGHSPLDQQHRRSIYIHVKRSLITPLLSAFDVADTDFPCPTRFRSVQPTQALTLLNSDFLGDQAARLGQRARAAAHDRPGRVEFALRATLQRAVSDTEVARGVSLLRTLEADEGATENDALDAFCLLALNLNEFVYLD